VARYAVDVHEVLAAYHDGGALFLLGWSMGASVIFALLDLFPRLQPSAIVVVDQTPFCSNTSDWLYGAPGMTRGN